MKKLSAVVVFLSFSCSDGMEHHISPSEFQKLKLAEVVSSAGIKDIINGSRLLSAKCSDEDFLRVLRSTLDKVNFAHQFEKKTRDNVELDSYVQLELYNTLRSVILGFRNAFQKSRGRFEQIVKKEKMQVMLVNPANDLVPQLKAMGLLL